ncbi:BlaI/MecI/CopY family transcriptional regulator [Riemerella columbipharyngis]|uniref:Predicted transcriptional regulator n=1 Tax=Riemerella columbipharyngis TaxID=1071918 RepID=A0A1G7A6P9_9FLAO|nr:BlaI/MecI/CopY family transcriptional regulator [Riemerella columbipharyngis]SDE10460.1 Predicted transcriptional regulator [Riemerella columbipharyngis]
MTTLTEKEEEIMLLIWKLQGGFLRTILDAFPEPKPHQNTVSTFLKILTDKKFISIENQGRKFFYKIEISKQEYRIFLLKNLLTDYYEKNEGFLLLKRLKKEGYVSKKDVKKVFFKSK